MRRLRRWLVLGVVAAAAAGGVWLALAPDQPAPVSAPPVPSVAVARASIVLRHRGHKQAEIAADRVEVSPDGRRATFTGSPQAVWFDRDQPALLARGHRIVYDRASRDVVVDGGLHVTTRQGYDLRAPSATWSQEAQVVELAGGVEVSARLAAVPAPAPPGVPDGPGRLRADRVRYDARNRVVVATGNVVLVVRDLEVRADRLRLEETPQIVTADGRVRVRQREAVLTAPALRYVLPDATADVTGGAVLVHGEATVRAPRIRFDLREQATAADGGVEVTQAGTTLTAAALHYRMATGDVTAEGDIRIVQPGTVLTGRRLTGNLRTRRAEVRDDVTLVRTPTSTAERANESVAVTAARVVIRWETNEADAEERVVVRQRDRVATADRLTYSEPQNRLVLAGGVVVEETGSRGEVTRLTCVRLVMTLRARDFTVEGPLRVTQKDRWATGERGAYAEATRRLVVTGNVVVEEGDGRRLTADRVTVSLADDTFEAEGNVQTQFVIRSGPTPRP
jgi:lipopolysaccharide transport protein LptA